MDAVARRVGALDPAAGDGGEQARGALDRGALHVVLHAADAAHLLAAAGAAGAAVDEDRQRRAVAGGGLGAQAVADQDAAVERGEAEDGLLRHRLVVGEDRGDEAALAATGERDRLVKVVVGHDGGHGTEGLDVVDGGLRQRVVGVEDDRIQEGALLGVAGGDADVVGVAGDDLGLLLQLADALAHLLALVEAGEGAHAGSPRSPGRRARSSPAGRRGRRPARR